MEGGEMNIDFIQEHIGAIGVSGEYIAGAGTTTTGGRGHTSINVETRMERFASLMREALTEAVREAEALTQLEASDAEETESKEQETITETLLEAATETEWATAEQHTQKTTVNDATGDSTGDSASDSVSEKPKTTANGAASDATSEKLKTTASDSASDATNDATNDSTNDATNDSASDSTNAILQIATSKIHKFATNKIRKFATNKRRKQDTSKEIAQETTLEETSETSATSQEAKQWETLETMHATPPEAVVESATDALQETASDVINEKAPAVSKPITAKPPSFINDMLYLALKLSAITLAITLLLTFLFGIIRYQEPSMAPAIKDGDLVLFYRYNASGYQPRDAIVMDYGGKRQVRRVVATEGDVVDITADGLVINGAPQQEMEIYQHTERYQDGVDFPLTVPEGQVFVLSDSRVGATDSRIFGCVEIKDTLGKVITVIRRRSF